MLMFGGLELSEIWEATETCWAVPVDPVAASGGPLAVRPLPEPLACLCATLPPQKLWSGQGYDLTPSAARKQGSSATGVVADQPFSYQMVGGFIYQQFVHSEVAV